MRFEEYWKQVEQLNILSNEAIRFLPVSLSDQTKRRLMKKSPEEVANLLDSVIDEINNGSIEGIDILLRRRL